MAKKETGALQETDDLPKVTANAPTGRFLRAPDTRRSINFLVHALAGSLNKGATRYYGARFDIKPHEIRLLNTLYSDGALTARDLGVLTVMDKALASRALAGLSKAGYICASDGVKRVRLRKWQLTPKGEKLVEQLIPEWTARWNYMLGDFNEADKQQIQTMLEVLLRKSESLCALEARDDRNTKRAPSKRPKSGDA